jgi:hypothetical protein
MCSSVCIYILYVLKCVYIYCMCSSVCIYILYVFIVMCSSPCIECTQTDRHVGSRQSNQLTRTHHQVRSEGMGAGSCCSLELDPIVRVPWGRLCLLMCSSYPSVEVCFLLCNHNYVMFYMLFLLIWHGSALPFLKKRFGDSLIAKIDNVCGHFSSSFSGAATLDAGAMGSDSPWATGADIPARSSGATLILLTRYLINIPLSS